MRDFRDAKTMGQSLRKALATHGVTQNHSQCLELILETFGPENRNTLSTSSSASRDSRSRDRHRP